MLSRRTALLTALAGLVSRRAGTGELSADLTALPTLPLQHQAKTHGLIFGAAVDYESLAKDPHYGRVLKKECALLTTENNAKWERLRPSADRFDFARLDKLFSFAEKNKMAVRGHTLTWHKQLPPWFDTMVTDDNAEALLVEHIQRVVGRYAGRVHSWDVVNEAVWHEDGRVDGLRKTPWLRYLGTGYIDLAFRTARAADPNALLVYNDFGLEYDDDWDQTRRGLVLDLLAGLVANGTPIDALGIQAHLEGHRSSDFGSLLAFIDEVHTLGLKVFITELDVADQALPAAIDQRDQMVAGAYEAFLTAVLQHPAVTTLITWGLADPYSWLNAFMPRRDDLPPRPLPLDQHYQRKACWHAIARSLNARDGEAKKP